MDSKEGMISEGHTDSRATASPKADMVVVTDNRVAMANHRDTASRVAMLVATRNKNSPRKRAAMRGSTLLAEQQVLSVEQS